MTESGTTNGAAGCPEYELLLVAARARFQPEAREMLLEAVGSRQDWNHVSQLATAHGLLPLLVRQIDQDCPDFLPPAAREILQKRFEENTLRTFLMACELIRLLDLFDAHGIQAIPFKGPALAVLIYGDFSLRQADDLDILIHEQDFWKASELLESRGFLRHPPILRDQFKIYSRLECDMTFVHGSSGLRIDLHWNFVPPHLGFSYETEPLWRRLESLDLIGRSIPALPMEDQLLLMCLHGSKHMWNHLEWICGVAGLLDGEKTLDWDRLSQRAKDCGGQRALALGLLLARDMLDAKLPPQALAEIGRERISAELAQEVRKGLGAGSAQGLRRLTWFQFRLIKSPGGRIRYCFSRSMLPSYKDLGWVHLPSSLSFLYFFLRPIRLMVLRVQAAMLR